MAFGGVLYCLRTLCDAQSKRRPPVPQSHADDTLISAATHAGVVHKVLGAPIQVAWHGGDSVGLLAGGDGLRYGPLCVRRKLEAPRRGHECGRQRRGAGVWPRVISPRCTGPLGRGAAPGRLGPGASRRGASSSCPPPFFVLLVGTLRVPCRGQRLGTGLELGQPYRRVGLRTPPACVTAVGNTMEGRRGEPRGISWRFRRFRSEGQQGRVR